MDSTTAAVLVWVVVFCAVLVRSTFGFGDALVAMPLLALFLPLELATPLMALLSMVVASTMLAREARHLLVRELILLLPAAMCGIPLGLFLLRQVDDRIVRSLLGLLILAFALFQILHPHLIRLKSRRLAPLFGFLAGMFGGAYNTHGPSLVLYGSMRGWNPREFRATLQGYFLPAGVLVLAGHAWTGLWRQDLLWWYFATSLPVLAAALLTGRLLRSRISDHNFARYVYYLLIPVALVLLGKAAYTLLTNK